MADFNITFNNNTEFVFDDLTDYSGLGTVDKTDLVVTYPPVTGQSEITLDLFDENIASLGDSFTFIIANQSSLSELTDGVYKFTLNVLNDSQVVIDTITKYFINDYAVLNCLRSFVDAEIDKECSDRWCEFGTIGAMLDTAKREAEEGLFAAAQEIMDNLVGKCNNC